jgi:hypothetical protein
MNNGAIYMFNQYSPKANISDLPMNLKNADS